MKKPKAPKYFENIASGFSKLIKGFQKLFNKVTAPPPAPEKTKKEIRRELREEKEGEAEATAIRMIQYAAEHPDDRSAREARRQAVEYLRRSQGLMGKGDLQDKNREELAKKYLEKGLSTPEKVENRKAEKLAQFNQNFGLNLTPENWDTMDKLMESTSFKKILEQNREKYLEFIAMVGDAVENSVNPVRIESALDIWQRADLPIEFDDFAAIVQLPPYEYIDFLNDMEGVIEDDLPKGWENDAKEEVLYNYTWYKNHGWR